jgi:hypothetical protein
MGIYKIMDEQIVLSQDEIKELQRIARVTLYTRLFLWPSVVGIVSVLAMYDDVHKFFVQIKSAVVL